MLIHPQSIRATSPTYIITINQRVRYRTSLFSVQPSQSVCFAYTEQCNRFILVPSPIHLIINTYRAPKEEEKHLAFFVYWKYVTISDSLHNVVLESQESSLNVLVLLNNIGIRCVSPIEGPYHNDPKHTYLQDSLYTPVTRYGAFSISLLWVLR